MAKGDWHTGIAATYNIQHVYAVKKKKVKADKKRRLTDVKTIYDYASTTPVKNEVGKYTCVYIIEHDRSGCFYIGVHTDDEPHSVLRRYFTSSKVVESIMQVDGQQSFSLKHTFYCRTRKSAELLEAAIIADNKPATNRFILNKAYRNKKNLVLAEWALQPYGGSRIAVNPDCVILNEDAQRTGHEPCYTLPGDLVKSTKTQRIVAQPPKPTTSKTHRVDPDKLTHLK